MMMYRLTIYPAGAPRQGLTANFGALALAAAVALVHGREVSFGFTSLDDLTLLVDDRAFLLSPGAVWRAFGRAYFHVVDAAHAYYRPIVTASYAVDARVLGGAASAYHATNVVLHLIATWLVHALLVRIKVRPAVAFAGALAFALHPAIVSAVAWIPGRNDELLAIFALGAVLTYGRRGAWRAVHLASFALALFTKETAVVVPLVCLAWQRLVERERGRDLATWAGWALALAGYAFARHRVIPPAALDWHAALRHGSVLVSSAGSLLLPVNVAPIATLEDTLLWPGVVALLAVAAAVFVANRRGVVRRSVVGFGAALYALALVPALFVGGSLALENRLYLPLVGALVVLAELADAARVERGVALAFAGVALVAAAALTFGAASAYRDPLAFGKAAVAGAPHSALAHFTLGQARQLRGDADGAVAEYASALALDPSEPIVHNNLAVLFMRRHEWARAERELEAELRVNPGYPVALENLALVRRRLAGE